MKRNMKKLAALFVTLVLMISALSFPVSAAEVLEDSVEGSVLGVKAYGYLYVDLEDEYAKATTIYSSTASGITAEVEIYYTYADTNFKEKSSDTTQGGGATAIVEIPEAGVLIQGAFGTHSVTRSDGGTYKWSDTTSYGKRLPGAIDVS